VNVSTIDDMVTGEPSIQPLAADLAESDVTPDSRITCIFVDERYRKHGYAKVALAGALDQIAAQGAAWSRGIRTRSARSE
jgi:GNAT superfamily N-acetyltransferase